MLTPSHPRSDLGGHLVDRWALSTSTSHSRPNVCTLRFNAHEYPPRLNLVSLDIPAALRAPASAATDWA